MLKNLFTADRKGSLMAAVACSGALLFAGCSNPTGTSGQISYFTEGVITDIEVIDIDMKKYNRTNTAAVGAAAGAGIGQIIGKDTEGTLIGAGIGALVGLAAATVADRADGMRLTVSTNQGLILLDQPYSCNFRRGAKIRMINSRSGGDTQVQVEVNGNYVTAAKNAKSDCPIK